MKHKRNRDAKAHANETRTRRKRSYLCYFNYTHKRKIYCNKNLTFILDIFKIYSPFKYQHKYIFFEKIVNFGSIGLIFFLGTK